MVTGYLCFRRCVHQSQHCLSSHPKNQWCGSVSVWWGSRSGSGSLMGLMKKKILYKLFFPYKFLCSKYELLHFVWSNYLCVFNKKCYFYSKSDIPVSFVWYCWFLEALMIQIRLDHITFFFSFDFCLILIFPLLFLLIKNVYILICSCEFYQLSMEVELRWH